MIGTWHSFCFGRFSNKWFGNTISNYPFDKDVIRSNFFFKHFQPSRNFNKRSVRKPFQNQSPLPSNINGIEVGPPPNLSNVWKPLLFTVAFSSGSLAVSAIWQYENARNRAKLLFRYPSSWFDYSNSYSKKGKWRQMFHDEWNNLSEGEKIFVPICFLNVLVYLAWQIPRFHPVMFRYFCSNPSSKVTCLPLVLSTFSHYSLLHLLANMYVLHSFCQGVVSNLGKEQFVGFYMTAGCVSSLVSFMYKCATGIAGLSLGASGAIMGTIGYFCMVYPNAQLGIIFLPFFRFNADLALKALIAVDTAGLIFRWQFFDHAAHLGGAFFGIFWSHYGNRYIWPKKKIVLDAWHNFRTSGDRK